MKANHKRILTALGSTAVCLLLLSGAAQAEQRYIADTIKVSLREGPGSHYKTIKPMQTGQSFDVLESKNGYVRVLTMDGDEGWLQEQFTDTRPPSNALMIKDLNDKIAALTSQNEHLATRSGQASDPAEVKKLQAELAEKTRQFNALQDEAKDVLRFKAEKEQLQHDLTALRATNETLVQHQSIYWFLAGGGVFFLGWMIGRISFRRQRHSLTL